MQSISTSRNLWSVASPWLIWSRTTLFHCLRNSFRDIFNFIPPFFPSSLLSGGLGGQHQEGDGLGLASPYAALLFPSNNKDNFDRYIYVWLSFSLCLGFCKILHGKEVRAYDIYARVVDVSEIERVSVANEWHLWYKNECVDTVQSTFHVVLCLFYTYWDIHHFSSLFVLLSKKYQLITIVKTFVKNASDYDSE